MDAKLKHIAKIEESSVEDNSTLERKVEESEKRLLEVKQENHTLQSKNASLQKALEWATTQNNQINDTKNQIQDSFNKVARQNKAQAAEIVDLKDNQDELNQKIKELNSKIKDLYDREKIYKETEEFYAINFQNIADKITNTAEAVADLKNLTTDKASFVQSLDQSLHQELNSQETSVTLQKIINYLITQTNDQSEHISDLQKRNNRGLKNQGVIINISNMGMGAGLNHGDGAGPPGLNTGHDSTSQNTTLGSSVQDNTIIDNVTKPIVKVLGELFSREDKKSIPAFKGKSTDKLITEWLKAAEHVAKNNQWDDDQKIRFFSDRLKGEALEWHDNYTEEQGNQLNYDEWRKDIIERFQDSFDLAALRKKLNTLKLETKTRRKL